MRMPKGKNFRFQTNSTHQVRGNGGQIRKEKNADSSPIKNIRIRVERASVSQENLSQFLLHGVITLVCSQATQTLREFECYQSLTCKYRKNNKNNKFCNSTRNLIATRKHTFTNIATTTIITNLTKVQTKDHSTHIRIFFNPQIFLCGFGLRPLEKRSSSISNSAIQMQNCQSSCSFYIENLKL